MRARSIAWMLAAWAGVVGLEAHARSSHDAENRRAEARRVVADIIAGEGVSSGVNRLKYLGEEGYATYELIQAFVRSVDREQRRGLIEALALLGHRGAEATLVEVLESDDPVLRMHAARGLGAMKSRRVQVLTPLLKDKTMGVRRAAAQALGASGQKSAGRALMAAAKLEGEPEARAEMLIAVGRSGDRAQTRELERFLKHSSESTRYAAARGLCLLGATSGIAFAKGLLASEDRFVRRQGLELFSGLPAKVSAPALRPVLNDPDPAVSAAAARSLYEAGDASMLEWLVLKSHRSEGDARAAIERELEALRLTDDVRRDILAKAGAR